MKNLLVTCAAALALTACGNATEAGSSIKNAATDKASAMMDTKTKAVLVYADWCGSCKILDPAVKKAQSMGPMPGVEFVVLDYTDKDEAKQMLRLPSFQRSKLLLTCLRDNTFLSSGLPLTGAGFFFAPTPVLT